MVTMSEPLLGPGRGRCADPGRGESGGRARAFAYHRPATLAEAFERFAAQPGSQFLAGGTDLLVRLRDGRLRPEALVSLSRVKELTAVEVGPQIRIGAMARFGELLGHRALCEALPALAEAMRTLGSTQIRNLATLGGNLCNASPCADSAPPLLVHEARVRILSAHGARELPLEDFFVAPGQTRLAPGELLAELVVDRPSPATRSGFAKKGRVRMDIAIASIAVSLELDGARCKKARVAAGSLGPRPMRLKGAEAALEGRLIDAEALKDARAAAEKDVAPITDVRSTEAYRRHMAGALLARTVTRLLEGRSR